MRTNDSRSKGFTLLELIVVLAGLGTLSSLAITNTMRLLVFNNIDEAKALLNSAAADCLQKSRIQDPDDIDEIDIEILSNKRLNAIGYKIDPDSDKCSYLQLLPTLEEDDIRFPIGFSVSDGRLSKIANPTSSDKASIASCENWAGVSCKQDESLKKLIGYKKEIAAKKVTCEANYKTWLDGGTSPYNYVRWDPNAETGCPSRPPKDGSESYKSDTCTPLGCRREVYGLDGEFVGFTHGDYIRALEAKYGKICTEWVAKKKSQKYTNDPIDAPIKKTPECGDREFWFFEGDDKGSADGINQAILKKAEDACIAQHEEKRKSGFKGEFGPLEGPGECGKKVWICNNSIMNESSYYTTKGCGKAKEACSCYYANDEPECLEHERSEYMTRKCGIRPDQGMRNGNCKRPGLGKPSNGYRGWLTSDRCSEWAQCMGYLYKGLGCQSPKF